MGIDAYENSVLLNKLKKRKKVQKPLRIAFLDIDSTMTGSPITTNITRKKLEQLGYAIVYVTARTEEMIMSSKQYTLSKQYHFDRPEPHLGMLNAKRTYIPPEKAEPEGLIDPDIIAGSTGTQILVRQNKGGYAQDYVFEKNFMATYPEWRNQMLAFITEYNTPQKRAFLANYDEPAKYYSGLTDVYQPKFRISLTFQTAKEKTNFRAFVRRMQNLQSRYENILFSDDSLPKKEQFVMYLTPKNGGKTNAVDSIIKSVVEKLAIKRSELHILFAGDGHADFEMGMKAARGTCATFILAGGSRLMPALTCKDEHPDLLDKDLEKLKTYFSASKTKGYYISNMHTNRNMIIGDEVYSGKIAVASILSLIEDMESN